jgi:hypothetical protein
MTSLEQVIWDCSFMYFHPDSAFLIVDNDRFYMPREFSGGGDCSSGLSDVLECDLFEIVWPFCKSFKSPPFENVLYSKLSTLIALLPFLFAS